MDIVAECIKWNEARYDRVSNSALSIALLEEEIRELMDAKDIIGVADACGDIVFVCMGSLWKLGIDHDNIYRVISGEAHPITVVLQAELLGNTCPKLKELVYLIYLSITFYVDSYLDAYAIGPHVHEICVAICKSNATKSIEGKTDPSVKANKDKGPNYVSPTEDLKKLLLN